MAEWQSVKYMANTESFFPPIEILVLIMKKMELSADRHFVHIFFQISNITAKDLKYPLQNTRPWS